PTGGIDNPGRAWRNSCKAAASAGGYAAIMIFAPSLRGSRRGAFPRGRIQNAFAQTKRFWRRFDVLIYVDVFDRTLERHPQRRFKLNSFTFALPSHVGGG